MGIFLFLLIDIPQYALVGVVQRLGQFFQSTFNFLQRTLAQYFQLAISPSKPTLLHEQAL
jgi:hypothetical protein